MRKWKGIESYQDARLISIASQELADPPPHKKTPPYLNSQAPAGTRAKAHDYEQGVCQLIVEAC